MRRLQNWAMVVAVAAAALLAAPDARAGWSAPFTVARPAGETPALAVSPKGDATVGWLDPDVSMMARRVGPRGRLGAPRTFTTDLGHWPAPKLAVARSGETIMAWTRVDGVGGHEVVVRRMSAAGRLGPERRVAVERGVLYDSLDPQLAMDAAGNATIAWSRRVGHDVQPKGVAIDASTIRLRRYERDGTLGPLIEIPAEGGFDSMPRLAVEPSGRGVITWFRNSQSRYGIRAALLGRDGTPAAPQDISVPADNWSGQTASVAMDREGQATIAWVQPGESAEAVTVRQLSALGLGPPRALTAPPLTRFATVCVVASMPGVATVAWTGFDDSGFAQALQARQIRGGELGPLRQIAPSADFPGPVLAADARGRTTIVWEQGEGEYPRRHVSVRARAMAPDGRLGATATLNPRQRPTIVSGRPAVGVDRRGAVTVVWSVQRKLEWTIRGARFTPRRSPR